MKIFQELENTNTNTNTLLAQTPFKQMVKAKRAARLVKEGSISKQRAARAKKQASKLQAEVKRLTHQ